MKRLSSITSFVSAVSVVALAMTPVYAAAEDLPANAVLAPIVITEVQPGTAATASEEFIELYNTTSEPIDLAAYEWRLEIASTTANNWESPFRTITLSGSIAPGQTYLVASQFTANGQPKQYLQDTAHAWFSAGIAATAGHIRLVYSTNQLQSDTTCGPSTTVVDQIEWSTAKDGVPLVPSIDGRVVFVPSATAGIAKTTTLQRTAALATPLLYTDSNNDAVDFIVSPPSTGIAQSIVAEGNEATHEAVVGLPSDACDPTPLPPDDPPAEPLPTDAPDDTPPDGGGVDNPSDPQPPGVSTNEGLLVPRLSEVLPDPAAPQTDDADEFVELYNPNDAEFNLAGFMLEVGITTKRTYVFPVGTVLAPGAFSAFFSRDTQLGLTNTNGQVTLMDPTGHIIAQTGEYGAAKQGQSWVFASAVWQWTTTPTPHAANTVTVAASTAKVKSATVTKPKTAVAAKKTASVKTAAAKTTKPKKTKTETQKTVNVASAMEAPVTPLHPGVLAVAAIFALLYGTYEYRSDLANKFHQLRTNRTARREARRIAKGR